MVQEVTNAEATRELAEKIRGEILEELNNMKPRGDEEGFISESPDPWERWQFSGERIMNGAETLVGIILEWTSENRERI